MKASPRRSLEILAAVCLAVTASAQTTYTLNPLTSFGGRGDGSIQPGDSIGVSPLTGNTVAISALGGFGVQPGDLPSGTNGYNMRGIAYDPVSGNLIFVDTHTGQSGSATMVPNSAIYVLDPNSGQIIAQLNTNGMVGGSYTHVVAGVAGDGVVYVCNQTTASTTTGFKIYRWATANTNDPNFNLPPVVAYTNTLSPAERYGLTMDVRGAGTNTQIIVGSGNSQALSTNILLFTTADGTNFSVHVLSFPGINTALFNDGIAFGPTNTCFAKQVGGPLFYLAWDPVTFAGSVISSFTASTVSGTDPLYNLAGIKVDNVNHLLAGLEEISGQPAAGPAKVWLFRILDPTNKAPAILSSRTYIPNITKATATMGYLAFGAGRLYANVVNNGLLASTVDSVSLSAPVFQLPPDYPTSQPRVTDLPSTLRAAVGQTAHFEVFAIADVTNYQWYSNNVPITGATTYFLNNPNVQLANSGDVYKVIASNAAGSTESTHCTLNVVSASSFYSPVLLWNYAGGTTNYITATGGATTPNERAITYNSLSNQLLVVRGNSFANLRVYVVNPDTGAYLYPLNTNGMTTGGALVLCGIGVADDGAVYACSVAASDLSFRVYRWANSGPTTVPQLIFGTNSPAQNGNPVADLTGSQLYRFGDNLAVHGAGINTEIVVDNQNVPTKLAGILRPTDSTMTNWSQTGYLLQNTAGSYGFGAYGSGIGRSLQFGPIMPSPLGGNLPTFWQKRYFASGAPLAVMSYNPGGGIAALNESGFSLPLYTNGPVGINFVLNMGAAINFLTAPSGTTSPCTLDFYDLTDPTQGVLLNRQSLLGGNNNGSVHVANNNAIGQVVFGFNPATGTNYVFVIEGNNSIAGFYLSGGVTPPPKVLAQPENQRILQGGSGSMSVALSQPATIEWYKGTNPPVDTGVSGTAYNIANAQTSAAGDYFIIGTNGNGAVTSHVAHVSIGLTNDNFTLTQIWGVGAGNTNFPYLTSNGGAATPNERAFAYNPLSNQLIIVHCPYSSTAYNVYVLDANSGSNLYTLNTTGVIHENTSYVNGSNPIDLDGVAVADDGAVYICCETPNASGGPNSPPDTTVMLHIYRWADSGSNTVPTVVYEGDPSGAAPGINNRWGDVMTARGSGTNTELFLNTSDGTYGVVMRPTDATMAQFTNFWFFDSGGGGSLGRSVQFGTNSTIYEKRKSAPLALSSYNINSQTSVQIYTADSSTTLGGVAVDPAHNLEVGVDFVGSSTAPLKPDAVALYDVSDPTTPMLLKEYNFPINQVANNNFICQTRIVGSKVYSLDANNGLMAFYINPPVNSMVLNSSNTGSGLRLSWGNSSAILQGTTTLSPSSWVDLTTPPQTNSVQPLTGGSEFYRLIQRR